MDEINDNEIKLKKHFERQIYAPRMDSLSFILFYFIC